jgi:hypothetical protein
MMPIGPSARTMVRTAVVLLVIAGISSIWELLAYQAPGSSLSLGILPGPIAALRNTCTILGVVFIAVAWVMPWASQPDEPRRMVWLAVAGVVLSVGASFYGALNSMYVIQIVDLRPDAMVLFVVKHLGHLLLGICLIDLARRILFRSPL